MTQAGRHIPEEHQPLCETCGYILEGLPADANCPECGHPVRESVDPETRRPPLWERAPGPVSFLITSAHALFRPSHFYRHLETRRQTRAALAFALLWLCVCSALLAVTALGHARWMETRGGGWAATPVPQWAIVIYAILKVFIIPAIMLFLVALTRLASYLTAWEAAYRGLRLPRRVVQRALDYHSVHLLPVCLLALVTVAGYQLLLGSRVLSNAADVTYLWTICGEVVVCAAYLFFTYWAAMRNIMFANR